MWRLKALVKQVEDMLHDGNANSTEDLIDDGGESGDVMSDAWEPEQTKVTTQKLSLLLDTAPNFRIRFRAL